MRNEQAGGAVGADPADQDRPRKFPQHDGRQRIPRKARERPASQPFGQRPQRGESEDEGQRNPPRTGEGDHAKHGGGGVEPGTAFDREPPPPASPVPLPVPGRNDEPRPPRCQRGIDREIQRQQHHRDPPQPRGHRGLIGEGGRDPVQPDREMPDPERPADPERALPFGTPRDERHPAREGEQGQRPEVQRRKAGCRHGAEQQSDKLRPAVGESDDAGRGRGHARCFSRAALPRQ